MEKLELLGGFNFRKVKILGSSKVWGGHNFREVTILMKSNFWGGKNFEDVKLSERLNFGEVPRGGKIFGIAKFCGGQNLLR